MLDAARFEKLQRGYAASTAAAEAQQQEDDIQRLLLPSEQQEQPQDLQDHAVLLGKSAQRRARSPRMLKPLTKRLGGSPSPKSRVVSVALAPTHERVSPTSSNPNSSSTNNEDSIAESFQHSAKVPVLVAKRDQRNALQLLRAIAAPDLTDEQVIRTVRRLIESHNADPNGRLAPLPLKSSMEPTQSLNAHARLQAQPCMLRVPPIFFAVAFGRQSAVELLISARADANETLMSPPMDPTDAANVSDGLSGEKPQSELVVATGLKFSSLLVAVEQQKLAAVRYLVGPARAKLDVVDDLFCTLPSGGNTALSKAV